MIDNDAELDQWWERFVEERSRAIARSMGGQSQSAGPAAPASMARIAEFNP